MQEQLKNIFVTKEVAKLAKEKGFNEWCAVYFDIQDNDEICANVIPYDKSWCKYEMSDHIALPAPTHFQLIRWLITKHKIYVFQEWTERWKIAYDLDCGRFGQHFKNTINDALIFALNLVEQ